MNLMRKSKMISFRLSPEEYVSLQTACALKGVRSVSDLARTAVQRMIASGEGINPVIDEVRSLQHRVRLISMELDKLANTVSSNGTANGVETS
jgi:hypothetical protein